MGDADINSQPSKKRAAGVQLTRDNLDLDDNEDSSEMEAGTFKKASEEVLATRRIVKVRRQHASTPAAAAPASSPASNPFAAIRLVPSASSAPAVDNATGDRSNVTEETDDSKPESKADELKDESAVEHKKTDDGDSAKIDESKSEPDLKENDNDADKQDKGKPTVEDVTKTATADISEAESVKDTEGEGNDAEKKKKDGVEKTAVVENSETESKNDVEDVARDEKKENVEAMGEKNTGTASFGLFQQLSNSQNAFSGFSGTGFSFGSAIKDGPSLGSSPSPFGSYSGPVFGLGSSNNGSSSIFGTSSASVSKNDTSKFPPMQEVPVETGEENEKSIFTADSVLFEYIEGAWKERGKGEIKVNVPTAGTGKARLVMRARGNYRLILNASIYPDMKLTNMDKRGITFACINTAAEGKDGLSTVALRFKDASIAENFQGVVTKHKSEASSSSQKTPENSPKAD